jgi:thioredoxin reductase (NADPH)
MRQAQHRQVFRPRNGAAGALPPTRTAGNFRSGERIHDPGKVGPVAKRERELVVIIGSGPAAWTAAIYAARAALDPLVYEGEPSRVMIPGGQLMYTTEVENYPGFPEGITGPAMMEKFKAQATRFGARVVSEDIVEVDLGGLPFRLKPSYGEPVETMSLIVATGARAKWLGIPNE